MTHLLVDSFQYQRRSGKSISPVRRNRALVQAMSREVIVVEPTIPPKKEKTPKKKKEVQQKDIIQQKPQKIVSEARVRHGKEVASIMKRDEKGQFIKK